MTSAQPHAPLSVTAPSTVPEYTPSYEVQVDLVRSVQPPDEYEVIPAAVRRDAAWDCVSFVPERGDGVRAAPEARVRAAREVMVVVN